ncbi:MAG: MetS family NSS transporter small subunit [Clostridia bacterium]|nr:MetS family NSS transporter small subunit [Clostridia bacterium]
MTASAIVMMCIACIGLWGGIAVSAAIMVKSNKKKAAAAMEAQKEEA